MLGLALLIGVSAFPCHAVALRAGVAKVDITPAPGLPMYGFLDRLKDNKFSTGTLDPLYARILVLQAGEKRLALVTLDLGRTFRESELVQLRQQLKASAGVSFLIVTASHTHSGPNILDKDAGGRLQGWETSAIEKISAAVVEASGHLVEARIGAGRGEGYIGYNRRQLQPDGIVKMLWTNPGKQPTSPLDPTVFLMRVDDAEGEPLAILVNYACHPVVFGSDNLCYSSDFVGVMRRRWKRHSTRSRSACFYRALMATSTLTTPRRSSPMAQPQSVSGLEASLARKLFVWQKRFILTQPVTQPSILPMM